MTLRRDWSIANEYRAAQGGCCVICGKPNSELAHIIRREYDNRPPLNCHYEGVELFYEAPHGLVPWKSGLVVPERVILLCGPATTSSTHHGIYDGPASGRGELNLLAHLSKQQQLQAVADAGSIMAALNRIDGAVPNPAAVRTYRKLGRLA